jgi:hypothetical protein
MLERFDHRPRLTAVLALSTIVLVVVVITLSTLLITGPQAASPQSDSGGNPGAAAAPANRDAGGENYGWDVQPKATQKGDAVERHAEMVAAYNARYAARYAVSGTEESSIPQKSDLERHAEMVAAYNAKKP